MEADSTPSSVECSTANNTKVKNIRESFEDMKLQSINLILKWSQVFGDSEGVDNFYEARIDEFIKEAREVEQALIDQKNDFMERLKGITNTLKSAGLQK